MPRMDDDGMYRLVESRDPRFDGRVYLGVTSTGIYCRPSCPAMAPKRSNMRFYRTAAAAQHVDSSSRSVPSDIVCERGSITATISSPAKRLRRPCNVVRIAVG